MRGNRKLVTVNIPLAKAVFRCHRKIDMVILLDSSASITRDQFADSKRFASDLVKHFEISKDRTNVAAVSFSQYTHVARNFSEDPSREAVLKAIDSLQYEGSLSRLDLALETLLGETLDKKQGARTHENGVKIVVVVFTDGFSSRGIDITRDLTEVLKNRGVEFFCIGASDRVNKDELNELTSLPIETHQLVKSIDIGPFTIGEIKKFAMEICSCCCVNLNPISICIYPWQTFRFDLS
ncbi:cartilage matrix protein-like isoform X2 [Acropora muricata]|uniref:cartilage matrix protein-like isoform X2 n=1 Tax=Acropora muricata TaxID=159855 RepID=UPI0034E51DA9